MSNGGKEEILEKLKKLEEKHETGEISDSRYRIRRIRLEEKLDGMSESDLDVNHTPQKTADEETNGSWKIWTIVIGLIIAAVAGYFFLPGGDGKELGPAAEYAGILEVNDNNFEEEVLNSDKQVVVYFYYKNCDPAWKKMPRVKWLADKTDAVKVCKAEASTVHILDSKNINNPEISREYRILAIPTTIVFENGKEVSRDIVGTPNDEEINDISPVLEDMTGLEIAKYWPSRGKKAG